MSSSFSKKDFFSKIVKPREKLKNYDENTKDIINNKKIGPKTKELVFVEVKTRRNYKYGRPEEAVTPYKQQQIRKIAQAFLTKNHIEDIKCRFDVLALRYDIDKNFKIEHFIDAF